MKLVVFDVDGTLTPFRQGSTGAFERRLLPNVAEVCARELREFLGEKVVRWWLPERWAFIEQVPLTSVGKFDKKTIRARYAENAYDVIEQRD